MLTHFKQRGRLFNLDAAAAVPEVFRDVRLALQEAYRPPPHLRQMIAPASARGRAGVLLPTG